MYAHIQNKENGEGTKIEWKINICGKGPT